MRTARTVILYAAATLLAAALVHRFHQLGGPYFEVPETIQDHISRERAHGIDAILLSKRAATVVPPGATVTVIRPSQKPNYDPTHFLTAAGMMPRHRVLPQVVDVDPADLPEYVLSIREPFEHPSYRLIAEVPEGKIYRVVR